MKTTKRIILVLRDEENLLKKRWNDLLSELGLTMADTIRYMTTQVWKKECSGEIRSE